MRMFKKREPGKAACERLIRLEEFEMWVATGGKGLHEGLLKRAENLAAGINPGPEREPEFHWIIREQLIELCRLFAERDDRLIIYNLGANIGLSTLKMNALAKSLLPRGNFFIYAIEPDPANLHFLEKNIAQNRANAKAFACAIADRDGTAEFHLSTHSNLGALVASPHTDRGTQQVRVFTLPSFAQQHETGRPHFLKVDVEGGEVEVLKGGREFLAGCQFPCGIIMEVHPGSYSRERSLEDELKYLFGHGWLCKYMVSAAMVQPDKFKSAGLRPFREFHSKKHSRGIYRDFLKEHLLEFACREHFQEIPGKKPSRKIVRSILIEKEP